MSGTACTTRLRPLSKVGAWHPSRVPTSCRALRTCAIRAAEQDGARLAQRYQSRVPSFSKEGAASGAASTGSSAVNPLNYLELQRRTKRRNAIYNKRLAFYGAGIAACLVAQTVILFFWDGGLKDKPGRSVDATGSAVSRPSYGAQVERLDAPKDAGKDFEGRHVQVVDKPGLPSILQDADTGIEMVETGTSTIPHFPRTITIPKNDIEEEYTLLGLGVRTVSFLSVEVYVLGLYVRATDLPQLHSAMVKLISPIGTSLIAGEKDKLRQQLLDAQDGSEAWSKVLQAADTHSAVRIVTTKSTDFAHLRDGWVRGITARTQAAQKEGSKEFDDEQFGAAIKDFKAIFGGRGKAPKGSTIILLRDNEGGLSATFEPEAKKDAAGKLQPKKSREELGSVADERISRLVWLGYLGGKNPSSEKARQSIVNGVMELVERPVGTVGMAVT